MRPHLHHAHPDENARRERVQRADGDDGGRVVPVEVAQDADPDGHADRRDQREGAGEEELLPHRNAVGALCARVLRSGAVGFVAARGLLCVIVLVAVGVGVVVVGCRAELLGEGGGGRLLGLVEVAVVAETVAVGMRLGVGRGWLAEGGDASAQGEAFEHLVEDDDDEQGDEGAVARDNQRETDYCNQS